MTFGIDKHFMTIQEVNSHFGDKVFEVGDIMVYLPKLMNAVPDTVYEVTEINERGNAICDIIPYIKGDSQEESEEGHWTSVSSDNWESYEHLKVLIEKHPQYFI